MTGPAETESSRLLPATIQYQIVRQITRMSWVGMLIVIVFMLFFFSSERRFYAVPGSMILGVWMLALRFLFFPKIKTARQLDWLTIGQLAPSWAMVLVSVCLTPIEAHNLEYAMLITVTASLMFCQRKYFLSWLIASITSYIACRFLVGKPLDATNWLFLIILAPWMTAIIRLTVNNCFRDLTEQEQEKKKLIVELKTKQDQLNAILNQAPLILSVIDSEGRYRHSHGSGTGPVKLEQNKHVGTHYSKVFQDFPLICDAIKRAISGSPSQVRAQLGEEEFYEIRYGAIYDDAGKLSEVIGVGIDVSESVRADAQEKQYLKKLYQSQKVESLETLAGGVAHDFNNYLMAIVGFCECIDESSETTPRNQKVIELIKDTAMQAAGVSNQMLVYAGKNNEASDEERAKIDLVDFLNGNQSFLQALVEKNVTLITGHNPPAHGKHWVQGDRGLLQQALINIVKNANDSFEGSLGTIDICVAPFKFPIPENSRIFGELDPKIEYCQIVAQDSGCGIANEDIDRIFDIYFTTKTTGNGIGLAVTASIIKNHGGAILCQSVVGSGTTLRLVLPKQLDTNNPDFETDRTKDNNETRMIRIAVVDDEEMVNKAIAAMLESFNCEVTQYSSGKDAVQDFARLGSFVCMLVDYSMPGLNGLETLQILRQKGLETPVILMSGFSLEFHNVKELKHRPHSTLEKPFNLQTLKDNVIEAANSKVLT